jgi:hypothetical protein
MADKWKFAFREDQTQFLSRAMEFIAGECDEQIRIGSNFQKYSARRTKERAMEIHEEIRTTVG